MNNILKEKFILNNGVVIPAIAIGTWQIGDDVVTSVIKDALEVGYTHIDTAIDYQNESGIGKAIKKVDRKKLFITTKIPSHIKDYDNTLKELDKSLTRLGVDYVDLILIHAPRPWSEMGPNPKNKYYKENVEVYKALEKAYKDGKVRAIGVSNFDVDDLQNILDNCNIKPQVNQIQVNIEYTQEYLINFCKENNILVEAYAPNATGRLLNNKKIKEMADKYGVSIPRLAIRYCIELGLLPLPKTVHKEYMIDNVNLDFQIKKEDMEKLLDMARK